MGDPLARLLAEIRGCRICVEQPLGAPLPHEPRPVLQVSADARLAICGQAPGTKVHRSGRPFTDRSGERLRAWTGLDETLFYDADRVAIIPMGFCFPGQTSRGADLPPRPECRANWHNRLMSKLEQLALILVVGRYAIDYHLPDVKRKSLTEVVGDYARYLNDEGVPKYLPLPHPSWRNTAWLKKNPWFEADYLPLLRGEIVRVLGG